MEGAEGMISFMWAFIISGWGCYFRKTNAEVHSRN